MDRSNAWLDILVGVAALGVSVAAWVSAAGLPPPRFDPLGSASVPLTVATILSGFGVVILIQGLRRLSQPRPAPSDPADRPQDRPARLRPWLTVAFFAMTVAYVWALSTERVRYSEATAGFLVAAGLVLGCRRPLPLAFLMIAAILLGYGGRYLFTRVFYVDLP